MIYAAAGWGLVSGDVGCRSSGAPGLENKTKKRNLSSFQIGKRTDKEALCKLNSSVKP